MAKGNIVVLKNNKLVTVQVELESNECPIGYTSLRNALDGGYLEHIQYNRRLVENKIDMWCDEEGKLKELAPEIVVFERETNKIVEVLVGPIVFTGSDGYGNSLPLTDAQIAIIKEELLQPVLASYKCLAWK